MATLAEANLVASAQDFSFGCGDAKLVKHVGLGSGS
jgi:hypothetical protein